MLLVLHFVLHLYSAGNRLLNPASHDWHQVAWYHPPMSLDSASFVHDDTVVVTTWLITSYTFHILRNMKVVLTRHDLCGPACLLRQGKQFSILT